MAGDLDLAKRIFADLAPGSRLELLPDRLRIRASLAGPPPVSIVFWTTANGDDLKAQARALVGSGRTPTIIAEG
ncbi:MAG: hypothetical protein JO290_06180 [Sphingomonadaceae bacterium]|nr:hypothetical protein [Sphingomonadaceae bacterium]